VSKPTYKSLQKAIARGEGRAIEDRWAYGRAILADPKKLASSGEQLRAGAIEALIADAKAIGSKLTETEIRRRIRCARTYPTVDAIRSLATEYETWWDLVQAGFPAIEIDEELAEPLDLELPAADAWDQLTLLPGFKETVRVHRRDVPLAELTVPESIAYRDKYRSMHEGFGKTLDLIERTVDAIIDGWDGDPETKAVDAYKRAIDEDGAES